MTPQAFVDQLNMAEMPRFGYKLVETEHGRFWGWPIYDQENRDEDDLFYGSDKKSYPYFQSIERQAKRLGRYKYETLYPANENTRLKAA